MNVAVTGGTGFIGKRLIAHLVSSGHSVKVLTRNKRKMSECSPSVKVIEGDLTKSCQRELEHFVEGADVLFHCAGELNDPGAMEKLHLGGTQKLIEAAAGKVKKWVQLSSVGAYGYQGNCLVTEATLEKPVGVYEITKTKADMQVLDAAAQEMFYCTIVRPSNVYGSQMVNRSLFQLIEVIEKGLFFYIDSPGAVANYIHVDNVVEALLLCGNTDVGFNETYIVSDYLFFEEFVPIIADALRKRRPKLRLPLSIVFFLAKVFGKYSRFPLTTSRVKWLSSRTIYDASRIQKDLGYKHKVSIKDGIRELVASWKARDVRN